jgi:hypothetical protein
MAIVRSIPSQKIINGVTIVTSELVVINEPQYTTKGESAIVVRNVGHCTVFLDSNTTDHVTIKAVTDVTIKTTNGLIDEEYDEIVTSKGACVELRFIGGNWYIMSSDGLKNS